MAYRNLRTTRYVVEARHPDGSLNVKEFPPFAASGVGEDEIFQYFFRHHPDRNGAGWDEVRGYFAAKGWQIREKTW